MIIKHNKLIMNFSYHTVYLVLKKALFAQLIYDQNYQTTYEWMCCVYCIFHIHNGLANKPKNVVKTWRAFFKNYFKSIILFNKSYEKVKKKKIIN